MGFTQEEWPGTGSPQRVAHYKEKMLVGYRWYDAHHVDPAFPFGHGLTYSTFLLSKMKATSTTVTVDIENTGGAAATETPQLYLTFPGASFAQLKGFVKVHLTCHYASKDVQSSDV